MPYTIAMTFSHKKRGSSEKTKKNTFANLLLCNFSVTGTCWCPVIYMKSKNHSLNCIFHFAFPVISFHLDCFVTNAAHCSFDTNSMPFFPFFLPFVHRRKNLRCDSVINSFFARCSTVNLLLLMQLDLAVQAQSGKR